jgi:hypothetical protein
MNKRNLSSEQSGKSEKVASFQNIAQKIRKHWFISLAIYTFTIVTSTWYFENEILVKPRDFEIDRLRRISQSSTDSTKPVSISLDSYVTNVMVDTMNSPVDNKHAPFKVRVEGVVSNAKNYYVYVVVNDGYAEWIEPVTGLGANVDGNFSCECYLGESGKDKYLNRLYKVYAVVTNREYKEFKKLDRKTIKAKSDEIELFRTK